MPIDDINEFTKKLHWTDKEIDGWWDNVKDIPWNPDMDLNKYMGFKYNIQQHKTGRILPHSPSP